MNIWKIPRSEVKVSVFDKDDKPIPRRRRFSDYVHLCWFGDDFDVYIAFTGGELFSHSELTNKTLHYAKGYNVCVEKMLCILYPE